MADQDSSSTLEALRAELERERRARREAEARAEEETRQREAERSARREAEARAEEERRNREAERIRAEEAEARAVQQRVRAEGAESRTEEEQAQRIRADENTRLAVGGAGCIPLFNKVIDEALSSLVAQHGPPNVATWPLAWLAPPQEEEDRTWCAGPSGRSSSAQRRQQHQQRRGGGAVAATSRARWPPPPPPLGPTHPRDQPLVEAPSSASSASSSRTPVPSKTETGGGGGASSRGVPSSGNSGGGGGGGKREPNNTAFDCDALLDILHWECGDVAAAPPDVREQIASVTYIVVAVLQVYNRISELMHPVSVDEEKHVQPLVQILLERALQIYGNVLTVRDPTPTISTQCRPVWRMTKGKIDRLGCRLIDKVVRGLTGGECPFGVEVKVTLERMIRAMGGQTRWYQTMLTEQATTRTLTRAMITTNLTHWAFTISNEQPSPSVGVGVGVATMDSKWVMVDCRTSRPSVVATMLYQMVEALEPVVADLDRREEEDAAALAPMLEATDFTGEEGRGGGGGASAAPPPAAAASGGGGSSKATRSGRSVNPPQRLGQQQQHVQDDDVDHIRSIDEGVVCCCSSSPTVRGRHKSRTTTTKYDADAEAEEEADRMKRWKSAIITACIAADREERVVDKVERWLAANQCDVWRGCESIVAFISEESGR